MALNSAGAGEGDEMDSGDFMKKAGITKVSETDFPLGECLVQLFFNILRIDFAVALANLVLTT